VAVQYPKQILMHYDPTVSGVWIGFGTELGAVCGQSEFIGVTDNIHGVDCLKCKAILGKRQTETA
jgi:hypothetical protein